MLKKKQSRRTIFSGHLLMKNAFHLFSWHMQLVCISSEFTKSGTPVQTLKRCSRCSFEALLFRCVWIPIPSWVICSTRSSEMEYNMRRVVKSFQTWAQALVRYTVYTRRVIYTYTYVPTYTYILNSKEEILKRLKTELTKILKLSFQVFKHKTITFFINTFIIFTVESWNFQDKHNSLEIIPTIWIFRMMSGERKPECILRVRIHVVQERRTVCCETLEE